MITPNDDLEEADEREQLLNDDGTYLSGSSVAAFYRRDNRTARMLVGTVFDVRALVCDVDV